MPENIPYPETASAKGVQWAIANLSSVLPKSEFVVYLNILERTAWWRKTSYRTKLESLAARVGYKKSHVSKILHLLQNKKLIAVKREKYCLTISIRVKKSESRVTQTDNSELCKCTTLSYANAQLCKTPQSTETSAQEVAKNQPSYISSLNGLYLKDISCHSHVYNLKEASRTGRDEVLHTQPKSLEQPSRQPAQVTPDPAATTSAKVKAEINAYRSNNPHVTESEMVQRAFTISEFIRNGIPAEMLTSHKTPVLRQIYTKYKRLAHKVKNPESYLFACLENENQMISEIATEDATIQEGKSNPLLDMYNNVINKEGDIKNANSR